jgi:hypothetical protein
VAVIPPEMRAPEPVPALEARGALCIVVCVYGAYQNYIPLYIYTALRSYPDYFVRVYLREELLPHNRRALEAVREGLSSRFEVRENSLREFPDTALKSTRWLIPYEDLSDFEYAYFGDVDFIICREDPDIRARHVGHCRENDLPYSNAVRVRNPPVKRLSGLHFIIVKPYYERMGSVIAQMRDRIISEPTGEYAKRLDESLLYEMVERGIGRFPPLAFRPWHGIHLGVIRCQRDVDKGALRSRRPFVIGELLRDPVYRLVKRHMDPAILKQVRTAQALCAGHWWYRFL